MKKLLIVESPAKIKTISKFLGKDFKIMSTVGHIIDLPKKKIGVSVNGSIDIEYVPLKDKEKVIAELSKAASVAQAIFLAPDPDREGEIIAWHVQELVKGLTKKGVPIHRITFNEITKQAVLNALKNPLQVDMKKVAAQQGRRVLDRWVGYEVSPVLWKKLAPGLSAGRVQSVALHLICKREKEIQAFEPKEYWSIEALFKHNKEDFHAALTHIKNKKIDIGTKNKATEIATNIKKQAYVVDSIVEKKRKKNPLPPFMTSTLQQAAFNRLGFSVKKTMQLAQKLYEGIPLEDAKTPVALITYMRTDSLRLSDTALTQARNYIKSHYPKEYLPAKGVVYSTAKRKKKDAGQPQDAHEAIRPIDAKRTPASVKKYITADLSKLYDLIWKRFIATQMKPAEYAQKQVVIMGGPYTFKVTGSTLLFDGFLKVYTVEEDETEKVAKIPNSLKEKDHLKLEKIDPKQHFTQPPAKYTEASLVKELEKEGIGRPSTYAAIMNTIQQRAYTTLDNKKRFTPTELGFAVTKMLVENLPQIMDVSFTAHMEKDLDEIAQGNLDRDVLLKEFYQTFQKDLKEFKGSTKKREAQKTEVKCKKCKKAYLLIRFGKGGEFLGCEAYPECTFTSNFSRNNKGEIVLTESTEPKLLDDICPICGKQLRQVVGKFGPFIACSGYPECKYIHQKKANFACPECKNEIVERRWRGGTFWGCKGYPKCKFSIFDEIVEQECPECKLPFLTKKVTKSKGEVIRCSDKTCSYNKKS
jgi:DNA topoisomerase I